jgi:hypothetical protein
MHRQTPCKERREVSKAENNLLSSVSIAETNKLASKQAPNARCIPYPSRQSLHFRSAAVDNMPSSLMDAMSAYGSLVIVVVREASRTCDSRCDPFSPLEPGGSQLGNRLPVLLTTRN